MENVRKARLEDLDTLLTLWKEFHREHDGNVLRETPSFRFFLAQRKDRMKIMTDFYRKKIRSPNALVLLAESDGKPAGCCVAHINKNIPLFKLERYGEIILLHVRKRYRARGLSSRFKTEVFAWLKGKV